MSDKFISPLYYCDLFTKKNVGTKKQRKDLLDKIHYLKKNNIGEADRSNKDCFRSTYEYGEELDWLREVIKLHKKYVNFMYQDKNLEYSTEQTQQLFIYMD